MSDFSTSLTLLAQVQSRQPAAWERLVELYAPLVHYWCRRAQLGDEDAADVFQEVFQAIAQHIGGFRRDRQGDTFRGWLKTIATNKIRDHFRRQAGQAHARGGTDAQLQIQAVADPLSEEDEQNEQAIVTQSLRRALEWIRGDFSEQTWQAFWRSQIEEQPTDLIASELAMTPAAVRKAKYRVLRRLREELDGLLD